MTASTVLQTMVGRSTSRCFITVVCATRLKPILASMDSRVERLVRKRQITPEQAKDIIREVDEMRANYLTKYTGATRYDASYYDLVIRSDGKTEDQIVDVIMQYIG